MSNPVTGPDVANWQKNFLQRYQAFKASVRALQMEKERLYVKRNKGTVQKMSFYFDAVDAAFAAMIVEKPEPRTRSNNDDRSIESGLADVAAMSDELMEEYLQK